MDIGKRIKSLRKKRNLTLDELASRCELTKGFLSQLERNLTSPSISTLEDIVEVLGISLQDFFKAEKETKVTFSDDDFFVDEKDNSTITWLVPNAQANEIEPILLTLKQNGESEKVSPHEGEEFGYVLQGRVKIVNLSNNEEHEIKKGETFSLKGEFSHIIRNDNEQTAKVLWVCTPPLF